MAAIRQTLNSPKRGFAITEFEGRLTKAQIKMRASGIDILLLMTEHEIRYFSGFQTQFWQSPTRPWFLLVPITGLPVAVIPSIGEECMGKTWIKDIRTWSSPHPEDDGIGLLHQTIKEMAGSSPNIGLPMGRETQLRMPLLDFEKLKQVLEKARWSNAAGLMQSLRSVKSEAEIEKTRYAAQVASAAFDRVPDIIHQGMSEIEVFRAFKIACLQAGADDVSYLVGGAGQGGYGDIISPPSNRPLQTGDVLILDVGCLWDGYFCDFDRNFAVGKVSDEAQKAYEICWQATQAGLQAAKPGASCADLFRAMNTVMQPFSVSSSGDVGRLGHGLGMQLTEHPSHTAWDQTPLEDGMVLTLEPGYAFAAGKMMVHEENIVIRNNMPCELLTTRANRTMPIIS